MIVECERNFCGVISSGKFPSSDARMNEPSGKSGWKREDRFLLISRPPNFILSFWLPCYRIARASSSVNKQPVREYCWLSNTSPSQHLVLQSRCYEVDEKEEEWGYSEPSPCGDMWCKWMLVASRRRNQQLISRGFSHHAWLHPTMTSFIHTACRFIVCVLHREVNLMVNDELPYDSVERASRTLNHVMCQSEQRMVTILACESSV